MRQGIHNPCLTRFYQRCAIPTTAVCGAKRVRLFSVLCVHTTALRLVHIMAIYGGGAGGQSGRNGQGGLDNLWRMAAPGCAPCNLLFGCGSAVLCESVFISVI